MRSIGSLSITAGACLLFASQGVDGRAISVRLMVEAGRNGRGLGKDVVPIVAVKIEPPIRAARSRVSGRGEDGSNGRAKPSGSGKVRWFAAVPKPGAARTRRREGCKRAR